MKEQPESGSNSHQTTPNTQTSLALTYKERFLKSCETLGRKPTQKAAEHFLYGDHSSKEGPVPDWVLELPE